MFLSSGDRFDFSLLLSNIGLELFPFSVPWSYVGHDVPSKYPFVKKLHCLQFCGLLVILFFQGSSYEICYYDETGSFTYKYVRSKLQSIWCYGTQGDWCHGWSFVNVRGKNTDFLG